MNGTRIVILLGTIIAAGLILWHDLPLEFPGFLLKALLLFFKLSVVAAVAIFAYIFAGRKKA